MQLLEEEKSKPNPNPQLVAEYKVYQLTAKVLANAGAGLFGMEYFEFSNYIVNELITGEGRRIHKEMERIGKNAPYNFKVIFGFTDSTFFTDVGSTERAYQFIAECKERLGVTVELKNVFKNMIVLNLKDRYLAWSGKEEDDPIYKGFEGLSDSAPKWLRRKKIAFEIIKRPYTYAGKVPEELIDESISLAKEIANNSFMAVKTSKMLINKGMDADIDTGLQLEIYGWSLCFAHEDRQKMMSEFLNKSEKK